MSIIKEFNRVFLFVSLLVLTGCDAGNGKEIFIRINQVGFLPGDLKTGVVFSNINLTGQNIKIINVDNKSVVLKETIKADVGRWGKYKHHYNIDFSELKETGSYFIEIGNAKSFRFLIGEKIYNPVVDSIMQFFKAQRCGPTNPILHDVCHLYDSPVLIGDTTIKSVDVTGGWHDAGDYIKFLNTSALTTYLLLFSYQFDKEKFGFDSDNDGVPDVLLEARVGIDWLLRCNYSKYSLINQVGDMRDHEVGWRLPENDPLKYERPAYSGIGKNQVGLFTAVMALAAKIWKEKFYDNEYSQKCLDAAKNIYSVRNTVPDLDTNPSKMYQDKNFWGKLALGAIELYNTTGAPAYLRDAKIYGDSAKPDFWWSWDDINGLVYYRLSQKVTRFKDSLKKNLILFNDNKSKNIFGEATITSWGSTNTFLGVALKSILWKDLTGSDEFDSLLFFQRDYILGKNPWGISFINGVGTDYPRNLHSQIAHFNNGRLPGAVSAGPAPKSVLDNYEIKRSNLEYNKFNSDSVLYFDDKTDYITNEPTIVTNATALFVFGFFRD